MFLNSENLNQATRTRYLKTRGYTLPEMLISMLILTFLLIGIFSFYAQFYKAAFINEQRNLINRDIRTLTAKLTIDGRQANYAVLYNSFLAADRDQPGDRQLDGNSGDLLAFVYTETSVYLYDADPIVRIIGYYRDVPGGSVVGPVRRFDVSFDPSFSQGKSLEELLPSTSTGHTQVIELSEGLADGRLFFNYWDRSIMVNGQIIHGNEAKRITETYNFTISPRG